MKNAKVIFFDIDGTLIPHGGTMPESTQKALVMAKDKGHKLVICTGRMRGDMPKGLSQELFDGFVCASGNYSEWEGKVISSGSWKVGDVDYFIDFALEHNILIHFQCAGRKCVLDTQYEPLKNLLAEEAKKYGIKQAPFCMQPLAIDELRQIEDAGKALYHGSSLGLDKMKELLSHSYEVTGSSFSVNDMYSGEVTLKGVNKALGMKKLLDYIGVDVSDSIAYGDGPNDYEMLDFAGIGVAMGNADDDLKKKADMVTDSIYEDGIYNSLIKLI